MDTSGIDRMLSQLRTAQALASRKPQQAKESAAPEAGEAGSFASALKTSLSDVSKTQAQAEQLQKNFTVGDPNTNLQDVVVAMQKSQIAFSQAIQVRNKLVQAYHDIMNTQV